MPPNFQQQQARRRGGCQRESCDVVVFFCPASLPAWLSTGDQPRGAAVRLFYFKKREKQRGELLGGPLGRGGMIQAEEWRRKRLDERDMVSPERCMHACVPQNSWRELTAEECLRANSGAVFSVVCPAIRCDFVIYACIIDYPIISLMISACSHLCIYSFPHHASIHICIHHFSICLIVFVSFHLCVCRSIHLSIICPPIHLSIYRTVH